jgi:ribosomal protein S18 acetylase RimI-like enzyme
VTGTPCAVRAFRFPEDYPAVHKIWSDSGPGIHLRRSDEPDEIAKKLLRDPDLFLVAELDGEIVGAVIGGFDGRRGMVYHLAVTPVLRSQGIGQILMDKLENRLRDKGCIRCTLLVDPVNEGGVRFYEQHGWVRMPLYVFGKDL